MDKDELVKKLGEITVPDTVIECHRLKLRETLMAAVAVKGLQKEANFWSNVQSRLDELSNLFRRPAWRIATVSLATVLVVLTIYIGILMTGNVSPTVLASDIALNSPELPGLLEGNGEIRVLNVNITGGTARVICGRDIGNIVQADVDLGTKRVTRTQRLDSIYMPELSETLKADAVNIAMTDPRVKQMLSQGGSVRKVMPSFSSISGVSMINESGLKLVPSSGSAVVQMEMGGRCWLSQTNLNDHLVERIIEPQLRTPAPLPGNGTSPS